MTRIIHDHKINPSNDKLTITVRDEPGAGGANHHYTIDWTERDGGHNHGECYTLNTQALGIDI